LGQSVATSQTLIVTPPPLAVHVAPNGLSVPVGQNLFLSGTFADGNPNAAFTDTWTVLAPDGTATKITDNPTAGSDSTPFTPAIAGAYTITLAVTDTNWGVTGYGYASIDVTSGGGSGGTAAPIFLSLAGPAGDALVLGQNAALTANFFDPNANPSLTASWTIAGPNGNTTLSGTPAVAGGAGIYDWGFMPPVAGNYTVNLTLTDNDGQSATASTAFTVASAGDGTTALATSSGTQTGQIIIAQPIALSLAPAVANFIDGQAIDLSAAFHDAAPGAVIGDSWTVTGPAGTTSQTGQPMLVSGYGTDDFAFVPSAVGSYVITFTVEDDQGQTGSGSALITVAPSIADLLPNVASLGPAIGSVAGGTVVAITGTNFANVTGVSFGGTNATAFTITSPTSISATAPANLAGVVDVTLTNSFGTSALNAADQYVYENPPTVASLSAPAGLTTGGASITISGTGFSDATTVMFGSNAATSMDVLSDMSIIATTPAATAGLVDVTVTNRAGASTATPADLFRFLGPAPTVTGLSPSVGSTAGQDNVTITGTGFTGATAVSFGTTPLTVFTINSDTSISLTTPANAAATVDVTVTTPSGTSDVT